MTRAIVIGGSLGGLTADLVLRDRTGMSTFWNVVRIRWRGAGLASLRTRLRFTIYLVERAGTPIGAIGLPARRIQYLDEDGSIAHEQPPIYRFASYVELYRGLLNAFGTERFQLSKELAHLDNRADRAARH